MPQIAQLAATYSSQIFWLLLTFGFVFVVIGLGMVPKIQSVVALRDKTIADDLASAKAAFADADGLEEKHRKQDAEARTVAQQVVLAAKASAAKESEALLHAADAEIAGTIAEAEARIAAARSKAMAEVEDVAGEAASDMVARIAGLSVSPEAAKQAVKAVLTNG